MTVCVDGCRFKDRFTSKRQPVRPRRVAPTRLFGGLSLLGVGTGLTVSSPVSPLSSQEEDFVRPSSREEAQQLWEAERVKMRQLLAKQQRQMVEDYQWLRQEERSLVSGRCARGKGRVPRGAAGPF